MDAEDLQIRYLNGAFGFPLIAWPFELESQKHKTGQSIDETVGFNGDHVTDNGIAVGNRMFPLDNGSWYTIQPNTPKFEELKNKYGGNTPTDTWLLLISDPEFYNQMKKQSGVIAKAKALLNANKN